ncbi:MAG: hypothetical protein Q8Q36_00615 [bacterium]|nr:hypothetical protein [bacterium]
MLQNNKIRVPRELRGKGSDPRFLYNVARELQCNPRDAENDLKLVERALKHIVQNRPLSNASVFLQDVGMAMEHHGFDSGFSRAVRDMIHRIRNLRFQEAVFRFLPELGRVP